MVRGSACRTNLETDRRDHLMTTYADRIAASFKASLQTLLIAAAAGAAGVIVGNFFA